MMTRPLTTLGVMLVLASAFAISAANATAAVLPEFTVKTKFTGSGGSGKLNATGAEIKWTSLLLSGSPSSKH